jgi:hypothetical protein
MSAKAGAGPDTGDAATNLANARPASRRDLTLQPGSRPLPWEVGRVQLLGHHAFVARLGANLK